LNRTMNTRDGGGRKSPGGSQGQRSGALRYLPDLAVRPSLECVPIGETPGTAWLKGRYTEVGKTAVRNFTDALADWQVPNGWVSACYGVETKGVGENFRQPRLTNFRVLFNWRSWGLLYFITLWVYFFILAYVFFLFFKGLERSWS
jgi:hypothetical protein